LKFQGWPNNGVAAMTARLDVDRVVGGITLIVLHEADALSGHLAALATRLRSAAQTRALRDLLREQRSLARQTQRRLRDDQMIRRELWQGLLQDLRSGW
jgi:hypothetical protein